MLKRKLMRIANIIEKLGRIDMGCYLDFKPELEHNHDVEEDLKEAIESFEKCGAAACIAGETMLTYRKEALKLTPGVKKAVRKAERSGYSGESMTFIGLGYLSQPTPFEVARRILHLTREQAARLFLPNQWPISWQKKYYRAYRREDDIPKASKIAADYIRWFYLDEQKRIEKERRKKNAAKNKGR